MTIRWDAPLARHLAAELHHLLDGTRVRAIRLDGESRDLVLFFRERTLVWRLHPTRGYLSVHPPGEPAPQDLRLNGRVRRVTAPADERIVRVELLPHRSGQRPVDLVVELLGNQWNAVVADAADGRIRHVLATREGSRTFRVGATWTPPPASGRAGVDGTLTDAWWEGEILAEPPPQRRRALVSRVAWTSPVNAEPLLDLDAADAVALWRRLADPTTPTEAVVLRTDRGLQPYPIPLPGVPSEPASTLLEAFARVAREEEGPDADAGPPTVLPPTLVRHFEDTLDAARRRATALTAEADALPDPSLLRGTGDLILARFHSMPQGRAEATLEGFDGAPVTVALDPALSAHENADAYYERATRAERAARRLPGLVADARDRVAVLELLGQRIRAQDIAAQELEAALPRQPTPERGQVETGPTPPYRTFRSSGGLEIRVGRGARHNDDLTFHHSAPDDVWLHAQQAAGAHVILRWGRKDPPPARDLMEAAVLAALHSRARTSGSVPVLWTFRKYVRKPRKAPPGRVAAERVQTVFVEPDPAVAERLAE